MHSPEDTRYIPLRAAAGHVGRRFYAAWNDADADTLAHSRDDNLEAWDRAMAVQEHLTDYIAQGQVKAYQDAPPDASGREVIDIPPEWYEAGSFTLCIRTSRFFVFSDIWEPIYIDRRGLLAHLPKIAGERNAGRYHAKDVVHAAWKLALMAPEVSTKAELTRRLLGWLADGNLYPDPSTLDDIVSEVVAFLHENKSGRGVCESLSSREPPEEPA